VLGEKWTLLVLREAIYGVRRFDDFARALKCGRGVLSARLKTLTEAGILKRVEYRQSDQRPRAEYHLDEKGIDLFTTIYALSQWGDRWMPPPDGPAAKVNGSRVGTPGEGRPDQRAEAEIAVDARPSRSRRDLARNGSSEFATRLRLAGVQRGIGVARRACCQRVRLRLLQPAELAGDKPTGALV